MRAIFFLLIVLIPCVLSSAESSDSTKSKLIANGTFSINSNGISSIPAFSLGSPAIVATLGLAKGRISYDPTLAYGLDMKPWYIDSWVHYMIVDRSAFKMRTGINFSMYFSDLKLPDEEILQGQRYWALELAGFYYPSPESNITLMYWNDRGQDPGTITGHFISLSGEKNRIKLGRILSMSVILQLFYIDYTGSNDGLFVSPKISLSAWKLPMTAFFQATQPLTSNTEPSPGFEWNVGLAYSF